MIHTLADFVGASKDLEGNVIAHFVIDGDVLPKLDELKDDELVLEVDKYYKKRSLNANAYFWKLCDMIAKALGTDKDTVYLLELSTYGVFVDIEIVKQALPTLQKEFRHTQIIDEDDTTAYVRCYIGSSHYNSKEMAELINGTVSDAHDIGIETWTQAEIDNLIENWRCT
ncbi:MAG: hypothetical protein MJ007_02035 [Paludibacteraceae bacterium]|nr:hypothetical protein [Paludibacteraceae bacterium]